MIRTVTIDTDVEILKDILWAIKGMHAVNSDGIFGPHEIDALTDAILKLSEGIGKEGAVEGATNE